VDIASYPRPDGDTGGEDLGAMCGLGGDGGPAKQPAYCGLIPCPSGVAAFSSSTGCSCGSAAGSFRVADMCLVYRCPDGQLPGANCQCADAGGYEPGRPPAPPVVGIDELCSLTPIGASLWRRPPAATRRCS
jgi:hypothetical protein